MLKGTGASGGIGIGYVKVVRDQKPVYERRRVRNTDEELKRLHNAVKSFVETTEQLAEKVEAEAGKKEAGILRGHIMILKDPVLAYEIEKLINGGECAEAAVEQICNMFISVFASKDDDLTQQRAADMEDLKSRLIKHLLGMDEVRLSPLLPDTVICARELTPSMTAGLDRKNVAGFITEKGGETSHCAILARALDIPAVLGTEGIVNRVCDGQRIILDGETGEIIIQPDKSTEEKFRRIQEDYYNRRELLRHYLGKPTTDADGNRFSVLCNIGNDSDVNKAIDSDGEGVGLFRTEFLYLDRKTEPDEQEQFEVYRSAALKMSGKPVVIRTFDIGGDKEVPYLEMDSEANPFLGIRAIRYCCIHPEMLRSQLRAILRASAFGDLRILIPMVSDIPELIFVKNMIGEIKTELREKDIAFNEDIKVGVMIETPSACLTADILAKESDFFSIGTNDLIQYTMAADRGNSQMGYLYSVFKLSVLRAIRHTISCAKAEGIPVEMCGEAAADPLLIPLLISYGLDSFSVSPTSVLTIRKEISRYTKQRSDEIAAAVEGMTDAEEIKKYLRSQIMENAE